MYNPLKDIFSDHCEGHQKFNILINELIQIFNGKGTCTFMHEDKLESRLKPQARKSVPAINLKIDELNILIDNLIKGASTEEEKKSLERFLLYQADEFKNRVIAALDAPTYVEEARPRRIFNLLKEKAHSISPTPSLFLGSTFFDTPVSHEPSVPSSSSIPDAAPKPPAH